jgi:hypothetical protein
MQFKTSTRSLPRFSEIPLPSEFHTDMVWESALEDIAICSFPVLAPVPFGAKIIKTHSSNKEFIENIAPISPIHEAWAKLISDIIKQHEANDENEKIFNKILQAKNMRSSTCHKPPKYVLYKGTYVPYDGTYGAPDQGQMLDM